MSCPHDWPACHWRLRYTAASPLLAVGGTGSAVHPILVQRYKPTDHPLYNVLGLVDTGKQIDRWEIWARYRQTRHWVPVQTL